MKLHIQRRTVATLLCFCFALLLAAHAFCYLNLSYGGESLFVSAAQDQGEQIAGGQFLQPFYWKLRGPIASPLVIGLLSGLYIFASLVLLCDRWRIESPVSLFLLCGALTLHVSLTALNASSLHQADVVYLAFLLCAAAALLLRVHALPAGLLLCAAMALHPAACAFFLSFFLIDLLRGARDDVLSLPKLLLRLLLSVAMAAALYAAGYLFLLRRQGLESSLSPHMPALTDAWLYPVAQFFSPLTAYPHAAPLAAALLAVIALLLLVAYCRGLPAKRAALAVAATLLLPLAVNLPTLSSASLGQTSYAYSLIGVYFVVLLDTVCVSPDSARARLPIMQRLSAALMGVIFLGSVVFSNQVYLKKCLEYQATASAMNRVVARAENIPGFRAGFTPVLFVGSLEDSSLSVSRRSFEHLEALEAAKNNYAIRSASDAQWFCWQILGYPFDFLDAFEGGKLAETEAVRAMPAFPEEGSVQMIEGVVVVKFSD